MNPDRRLLAHKPPRIAFALLGTAIIVYVLAPLVVHPPAILGGLLAFAIGFAVMLRAWWLFRRERIGICPTDPTERLIVDDVYALSRHPMYLGMLLMLIAPALATGALPFYAAAAILGLVLNGVFCPFEERKLTARFGRRYEDYRRRVRRWL